MSAPRSSTTSSPRSTSMCGRSGRRAIPAREYTCDALIMATGAQAKWLGIPSERIYQGFRRVGLRDLRRLLLPQQGRRGDRRRQFGGRGSALPLEHRQKRDGHPPAQRIPRRAHPSGAAVQEGEHQGHLGHGRRRDHRQPGQGAAAAVGQRAGPAQHPHRRGFAACRSTACSSPSAMRRRSSFLSAS